MKHQYIIKSILGFYTGTNPLSTLTSWDREYPNATIFERLSEVKKAYRNSPVVMRGLDAVIIKDYGLDSEIEVT